MLQLILAPTKGWHDISTIDERPLGRLAGAFYIFIAIASLSWILQGVYQSQLSWPAVAVLIVLTFATLFVSYFIATFILSVALQPLVRDGFELNETHVRTLVIYSLSLLTLIWMVSNLLYATTPVFWFLPCYIPVIIWKGWSYLQINSSRIALYVILSSLAIILPPVALAILFKALL